MKRLVFLIIFIVVLSWYACGQCTTQAGYVCITQETANKADAVAKKYEQAVAKIAALEALVAKSDVSSAAKDSLIAKLEQLGELDTQIESKLREMNADLRDQVKDLTDEVARLKKKLSQGRSKLEKLLAVLKVVYYGLAGVAVAIGL